MDETPIQEAVRKAGGQTALAKLLSAGGRKVSQGHIWAWLKRDGRPPEDMCPAIETATGVRCERLRSDVHWVRDDGGLVTGYHVPVVQPIEAAQRAQAVG